MPDSNQMFGKSNGDTPDFLFFNLCGGMPIGVREIKKNFRVKHFECIASARKIELLFPVDSAWPQNFIAKS